MAEKKAININEVLKNSAIDHSFASADRAAAEAEKNKKEVKARTKNVTVYITEEDLELLDIHYCKKFTRSRAFFFNELLQNWFKENKLK